ncbi:MAG TPA: hypothetical protein VFA44_05865 [Gaiellaceae bacterium]|nr:hypothetical protein [Gaiellaceae bacterium]
MQSHAIGADHEHARALPLLVALLRSAPLQEDESVSWSRQDGQ